LKHKNQACSWVLSSSQGTGTEKTLGRKLHENLLSEGWYCTRNAQSQLVTQLCCETSLQENVARITWPLGNET